MQLNFRLLSVIALTVFTTFTACKKDNSTTTADPAVEVTVHSEDQSQVSGDMDAVTSEVSVALEADASFSGGRTQNISICGATAVADTTGNPRTITITFNGKNCTATHNREGVIVLSMPAGTRWKNAGAEITATYKNLKITRLSDNKSITINGSHTLTNVSGGLLKNLSSLASITHTINSNGMSIKFDDNTERIWQVARKRVYTYSGGVVVTISGTHTDGNNTNIAEWGINRFGHAFTTLITQPLVIRQDCNFRLTAGQVEHKGMAVTATATFGLDVSGLPTSCPATGGYYFKLVWVGANGNTTTKILPY